MPFLYDLVVVGGCGHVGLPLAIAFAQTGATVAVLDLDEHAVKLVNGAVLPFAEAGAQPLLQRAIAEGRLHATTDAAAVADVCGLLGANAVPR